MIVHNMPQGSPEWFAIRCGIPTASNYDKIITGTGKPSTSAQGYMNQLLADWLAGGPTDAMAGNYWMERGSELEEEARKAYSIISGREVEQVGFITDDSGLFGCSPDGLVNADGGLEIKCPKASTLVSFYYLLRCPPDYYPQIQGCMWITGRVWWDFFAFHPALRPYLVRVERDEEYIGKLSEGVIGFVEKLKTQQEKLKGWKT